MNRFEGESLAMDTEKTPEIMQLGAEATGSIDPGARTDIELEKVQELARKLQGDVYDVQIADELQSFLLSCIDGRTTESPDELRPSPNAAGGTMTPFISELLTQSSAMDIESENTLDAFEKFVAALAEKHIPIGGHGDDHSSCGCGANAKAAEIVSFIATNMDVLVQTLESATGSADYDAASFIQLRAKELVERDGFFSQGEAIDGVIQEHADEKDYQTVRGGHNEVIIRLNTKHGTTLDRHTLKHDFGDAYQVFNVDVWAFEEASRKIGGSEEEIQRRVTAMVFYNLATAFVLCGPTQNAMVR